MGKVMENKDLNVTLKVLAEKGSEQVQVTAKRKKVYIKPALSRETFIPNDYVAACTRITDITATCARPGSNGYQIGDGTSHILTEVAKEGPNCAGTGNIYHGICGDPSTIYLDGSLNGLENNGQPITNVIIGAEATQNNYYKITSTVTAFSNLKVGSTYNATWYSTDKNGCSYTHWGALKVTGYSHS